MAHLGLRLNSAKTRHLATGADVVRELTRPDLTGLGALLRSDAAAGLRLAREMFDAESASSAPDRLRLKYLRGVLSARKDSHAVESVTRRLELLQADPKSWAR